MTLLQCIDGLIENITVTDPQEESIKGSLSNLNTKLLDKDSGLFVLRTFVNGSYERETNIRPLKDIDLFAVLNADKWKDDYGVLLKPQAVLTKMKNYLDDLPDYKGKVSQDRPCITIELSDKDFDVLPSFEQAGGGYLIPRYDLQSWVYSYPEQLTTDLNDVHRQRGYKVKPVIKVAKYWNRENGKVIPSFHIEEVAISIFKLNTFTNFEEAVRKWFQNAESYVQSAQFRSNDDYTKAINKIKKVKEKLIDAKSKYDDDKEDEAIGIWKDVFGKEFPTVREAEAKEFARTMSEGKLKMASSGILSAAAGYAVTPSKGYFGDLPKA